MEDRIQYGPYSPQEVERVSVWLKDCDAQFEIVRDDQHAKEALMNDGQNVVSLAEFRTHIYLAQIYYVTLLDASGALRAEFEQKFSPQPEKSPFAENMKADDDQLLEQGRLKQQRKKRGWAIALALYLVVPIIVSLVIILMKES